MRYSASGRKGSGLAGVLAATVPLGMPSGKVGHHPGWKPLQGSDTNMSQARLHARAGSPDPPEGTCKPPSGFQGRDRNKHPPPNVACALQPVGLADNTNNYPSPNAARTRTQAAENHRAWSFIPLPPSGSAQKIREHGHVYPTVKPGLLIRYVTSRYFTVPLSRRYVRSPPHHCLARWPRGTNSTCESDGDDTACKKWSVFCPGFLRYTTVR